MKKKIILIFIAFFGLPIICFSENCDQETVNKIYNQAKNINYKLTYTENNKYKITFINIPDNFYIVDIYNSKIENNSISNNSYSGGKTYNFKFRVEDLDCKLNITLDKNIYIQKYNVYSDKDKCKDKKYKDFALCDSSYQGNITDEIFQEELEKYNSKIGENQNNGELKLENLENSNNNIKYLLLIGGTVLFIIFVIVVIIKNKNKSRRFSK